MDYLNNLRLRAEYLDPALEVLIKKYKVEPVGTGYIDMIVSKENFEGFIDEITELGILVDGISWWCHCTEQSERELGCPDGMGGPRSEYYVGWFSETQMPMFELPLNDLQQVNIKSSNAKVKKYVEQDFPKNDQYISCLVPALWLRVPDDWRR